MEYKKFFFVAIVLAHCSSFAQNKFALVQNDCVNISATNWKSFNSKQIQIFDSILNRRDIIILSAPDHGYGAAYDVQCMLMKALIDSSRIKSIYIESSWMNCKR